MCNLNTVKLNFPLKKMFGGNENEVISANEIASFEFPRKIFPKRKLAKL